MIYRPAACVSIAERDWTVLGATFLIPRSFSRFPFFNEIIKIVKHSSRDLPADQYSGLYSQAYIARLI